MQGVLRVAKPPEIRLLCGPRRTSRAAAVKLMTVSEIDVFAQRGILLLPRIGLMDQHAKGSAAICIPGFLAV
jgi:hypothetical protein